MKNGGKCMHIFKPHRPKKKKNSRPRHEKNTENVAQDTY